MESWIRWQWTKFADLSLDDLYTVLKARQAVFIVEQHCFYLDADGLDQQSWHLLGWGTTGELLAYLRVTLPGAKFPEPSIGRVLVMPAARGTGLGRELMQAGIAQTEQQFPGFAICLSAQTYLDKFYQSFGFCPVSEPYDDAGVLHIKMRREAQIN